MQTWTQWQHDVVEVLRCDFEDVLHQVSLEDVDWPSWHSFFLEGRTPRAAVNRALERDL